MAIFSSDDLDKLGGPHVRRAWFGELSLPGGTRRLHTGMGKATIGGHDWEGMSDPFGGQLVGLGSIEEPLFGQAIAIDIVVSGGSRDFVKSMFDDRHDVEGVSCTLYFAVFDPESGETLISLKTMVAGKITAPRFSWMGAAVRAIGLRIVSVWEGLNFPTINSEWSPAGQRRRYAGDKGMDFINADIVEEYIA